MAIGIEVVPMLSLFNSSARPGMTTPRMIPSAMAANIQTVRYLLRNDNFFGAVPAGGQLSPAALLMKPL